MKWLFLALLAPAIDTLIIFIDKYLVVHKVKDSYCMPIYSGLAALIFATLLWAILGRPTVSAHNAILLLGSGVASIFAYALYFHALLKDDASYVNAALQTTPIFILILSAVLLGEKLSILQLVGFVLVFGAVMGLSVDKVDHKIKFTKAFYQVLVANIFFAIAAILVAFTSGVSQLVPIMAYSSWGLAIGAAILFLGSRTIRRSFAQSFRTAGKSTISLVFMNESLTALSTAVAFLAITLGPVALVGVLNGTQVFYALFLGVILTLLYPKIFQESIKRKEVYQKILFSSVLFGGILCIAIA